MISIYKSINLMEGRFQNLKDNVRVIGRTAKSLMPMAMMMGPAALMGLGSMVMATQNPNTISSLANQGETVRGFFGVDRFKDESGQDQLFTKVKDNNGNFNEVKVDHNAPKITNEYDGQRYYKPNQANLISNKFFNPVVGGSLMAAGTVGMLGSRSYMLSKQAQNMARTARQQYSQNRQMMLQNREQMRQLQQMQQQNPQQQNYQQPQQGIQQQPINNNQQLQQNRTYGR